MEKRLDKKTGKLYEGKTFLPSFQDETDGRVYEYNAKTKTYDFIPEVEQEGTKFSYNETAKTYEPMQEAPDILSGAPERAALIAAIQPSLLKSGVDVAAALGEQIDPYTGAPTRAALMALKEGKPAIGAFAQQFGAPAEMAPTGKQIAEAVGVKAEPKYPFEQITGVSPEEIGYEKYTGRMPEAAIGKISRAGVAGLGVDILADWTNIVPVTKVAKAVGEVPLFAAKTTAKAAGKGAGAVAEAVAPTITYVTKNTAKGISKYVDEIINPKYAEDMQEFYDIAKKNNIPLEDMPYSVSHGKSSLASRLQRSLRETMSGAEDLEKYYKKVGEVKQAINNKIEAIADGLPLDRIRLGEAIRKGYKEKIDNVFNGIDFTYKTVSSQFPEGLQLTDKTIKEATRALNKFEKKIDSSLKFNPDKTQVAQLNDVKENIALARQALATNDYDNYIDFMKGIGGIGYGKKYTAPSLVTPDKKLYRSMYTDLRDAVMDTVEKNAGKDVANSLKKNNAEMAEMFSKLSFISKEIENERIPANKLFEKIVKDNDPDKIKALVYAMPEEKINQIRAGFLNELISKNIEGNINWRTTANNFEKNKDIMAFLFSNNEAKDITDLLKLGDRLDLPFMSTSGTSQSEHLVGGAQEIKDQMISAGIKKGLLNVIEKRQGIVDNKRMNEMIRKQVEEEFGKRPKTMMEAIPGNIVDRILKASQVTSVQKRSQENDAMKRRLNK